MLSWPLLVALATMAHSLTDRAALLNDPDTYLHVAAGRWMMDHHALPLHDPFSHSMAGAPWVAHEWLAELVLAAVYRGLGWSGVVLLAMLCFAGGMALFTRRLLRHFEPFSALIIVGLSSALLLPHLLARPHVLALPLLVAWSASLFAAREQARTPPLASLLLMVLWANLHGSFMFGIALAAFVGGEAVLTAAPGRRWTSLRQWGGFTLLATLAALATPNGVEGLLLPLRVTGMPTLQTTFDEWMSPNFQKFQPLEIWLLGPTFLAFALGLRLPLTRLFLLLGLFHLALTHGRHADLLAVVAPLAVAASLGPQLAARIHSTAPSPLGLRFIALARPANIPGLALAGAIFVLLSALMLRDPIGRADSVTTPGAALAAAQRLGLSGPVFNSESFGGYLIFNGVPTFIDGRIEMYGDAFLSRYVDVERGDGQTLADILDQYGITWTLLVPQTRAVVTMDHMPGWQRVYEGPFAIIHRRSTAAASPSG